MGLALKSTSRWWYGRPVVNGRRIFVNLGIEVAGERPASLRELGDADFERSRIRAKEVYDSRYGRNTLHNESAEYHRKMYEAITGIDLAARPIILTKDLPAEWSAALAAKKRPRSDKYLKRARLAVEEFTRFALTRRCATLAQVSREVAEAWVAALEADNLASGTVISKVTVLRSAFNLLAGRSGCMSNPFQGVDLYREEAVHRRPLTEDELYRLVDAACPVLRGPLITGMCTAMRRKDCCLLEWAAVDLDAGFIQAVTSKTGAHVEIPIFPMLEDALRDSPRDGRYVWPQAARMFKSNEAGISYRTRKAFDRAGISRQVDRPRGVRKASVADFHALKTTWVTMALTAGLPMKIIERVTGNTCVDVVMKHYFRPGRDQFKKAVTEAFASSFSHRFGR